MTWFNRLKLLGGAVLVTVLVAAFTVVFTQRQGEAKSTSASIAAEEYAVGTDYGGTVTAQHVKLGDHVKKGEKLFEVQSLALLQDLKRNPVKLSTASYSVRKDGTMIFKSTVSGTVATMTAKLGDFVQSGSDLATIYKAHTLSVVSDYTLTPRDYQRIEQNGRVDLVLPNQTSLVGHVQQVSVRTTGGQAQAEIKVTSDQLVQGAYNGLVTPGTPVTAELHLRQDGLFAGPTDAALEFLRKVGL